MIEPTIAEREAVKERVQRAVDLVLVTNRVRLSSDDPILVVQTLLHDFLLQADDRQRDALRAFQLDLDRARAEWEESSRHRAETVLNAALTAARDAIGTDLNDAASQLAQASATTLNATIAKELAGLKVAVVQARRLGLLNVVAAILTVIAATIALAALMFAR